MYEQINREACPDCGHPPCLDAKNDRFFSGKAPFVAVLVISLIGVFAAGFLTYRHILLTSQAGAVGESPLCRAAGHVNCDAILLSPYALVFQLLPSSSLGLAGFTFLLWLSFCGLLNPRVRREVWAGLLVYLFAAIAFSWYYAYLLVFEMDFLCPWCMVVHLVNVVLLIFALVVAVRRRKRFELPALATASEIIYLFLGASLVAMLIFFLGGFIEKSLSLDHAKKKYQDLSDNPLVVTSLLRASPDYDIPVQEADPVYGAPSAPYSIVVFSDFQCPVCLQKEIFLRAVVDLNPNYLRLVFKNYPLSTDCNPKIVSNLHPLACKAAQAAYAAFILGKARSFWEYSDLVFGHQGQLKGHPWLTFADQIGLDTKKFTELMRPDSLAEKKVIEDVDLGMRLGLDSTPELFFEGKRLPSDLKGELFVTALEDLIRTNHPEHKDLELRK
jgi:uncharacterized membrane protein/protein-disulfide isomerase